MRMRLLRHATLVIEMSGMRILVDPMLGAKETMDPIANAEIVRRIPMVDLPVDRGELAALIESIDAVLLTHTHRDHWDQAARDLLPRDVPILCQPHDLVALHGQHFLVAHAVDAEMSWNGLTITRTGGCHGRGDTGREMAPVSGFVLRAAGEPTVYLAGDTVWCDEVADVLARFTPAITVVNAGAAQFLDGGPITMTSDDVVEVCRAAPGSLVVAVHMEAINHCVMTRADLDFAVSRAGLDAQVIIPADGETMF